MLSYAQLASEKESQPVDNINEANIECVPAKDPKQQWQMKQDYADNELVIPYKCPPSYTADCQGQGGFD